MLKISNIRINKGFTLIELMIVIGIIGILAVIAIPQYTSYIARAQVTEAMNILGGAKVAVAEYKSSNGSFPTTQALLNDIYPIASGIAGSTKYLANLYPGTNSTYFGLNLIFKSSGISSLIAGQKIALWIRLDGDGTYWDCYTVGITQKDVLPVVCR